MKQKIITRLYPCQYLRLTQESYTLSDYAKHHLTQNLVAKNLLIKNLVPQISDNRIYKRATDGRRMLDPLNAKPSDTNEHNPIFDKPDQFSYQQVNIIANKTS